ncbi:hypothetical protein PS710_03146 [Pseudomonas fluorescens]|uniref:Uncharacterized protein n=1 Tax=Pseudomonas fluorescens TaxID=294 RepID=A0A5E7CQ25_PSEFL|nr:hypothetical protein PS710_03146 [Pseudomonas fluorescens]VVQ25822.1 hypothetical protein PS928_06213 [Pseudomonas fluorescens]
MAFRFGVVPALPTDTESMRNGTRSYCKTATVGFNLYDNEKKLRLQTTYQTRAEAEYVCQRHNMERLQIFYSERKASLDRLAPNRISSANRRNSV